MPTEVLHQKATSNKMNFDQRSYNGKTFRPKPEVLFDPDQKLLLVATSWGSKSSAKKSIDHLRELYLNAQSDTEVTSPFEYLNCLSSEANYLRRAIMMTNDLLYQEENRDEYTTGIELFAMVRVENFLVWTQIGQPQILITRSSTKELLHFGAPTDLQIKSNRENLDPLPTQMLGLASTSHFFLNSIQVRDGDSLIAIARTSLPRSIYNAQLLDLQLATKILVEDSEIEPFWIGQLNF